MHDNLSSESWNPAAHRSSSRARNELMVGSAQAEQKKIRAAKTRNMIHPRYSSYAQFYHNLYG